MDLFGNTTPIDTALAGVSLLKGFALKDEAALLADLASVITQAPFRHMITPNGFAMSVAMSNCGALGWVTDRQGYRYANLDPLTQKPWPSIPASFLALSQAAALVAGYADFTPDACLVNRYQTGARMGLHQDKNERDFTQPIVSVSLGVPATFQFGGLKRTDKALNVPLYHGDVVVWGGEARLRYHGILPLKASTHPALGDVRINLTFRKAG
ncbi:DNA oxidative demethylase AlkB [Methylotenera sp. L2L1]|uniref:DNA oxidative demethylase AlkB n=1 Tax=Methylotenera sp. L2L1 TaxID=1502770 RepID=UPI00069137BE|nr:DNA oxidative demethylase AlkB [Methylotenera sp. L2L1]